jgi:hypothetical protein
MGFQCEPDLITFSVAAVVKVRFYLGYEFRGPIPIYSRKTEALALSDLDLW